MNLPTSRRKSNMADELDELQRAVENVPMVHVRPDIPKFAINDEPPWTPKLTPQLVTRVKIRTVFSSKKKLVIMTVVILIVIIVGVLVGNLITNAVSSTTEGKTLTLFLPAKGGISPYMSVT